MWALKAFLLGVLAIGVPLYAAGAAAALVAEAAGTGEFEIAIGPLLFVSLERHAHEAGATVGGGLILVALLAGALNVLLGKYIRRRTTR